MRIPTGRTRGALAGLCCFFLVSALLIHPHSAFMDIWWETMKDLGIFHLPKMFTKGTYMLGKGIGLLIPFITAVLVYYWLTCRPKPDGHTRCGKCAYILKGLSEPRCPECGTNI